MKVNKNAVAFTISLLFLIFDLFWLGGKEGSLNLAVFIAVVFPILSLIALIQKKDNLPITIGFYTSIIGAFFFILMFIGSLTGNFNGTGNLEGWEFIFMGMNNFLTELLASITYLIGLLKTKP